MAPAPIAIPPAITAEMTIESSRSVPTRSTSTFVDARSFRSHAARVTIKHWQLRDLITRTAVPNEIMYVCDRSIKALDTAAGGTQTAAEFVFEPRCLAVGGDVVAAGGVQRGQFAFGSLRGHYEAGDADGRDMSAGIHTFELGGFINNSISLFRPGAASVHALVCNNDHVLRLLDLGGDGDYSVVESHRLPVPLNHSSISPDGRTIVACGDSAEIFVLHPHEPAPGDRRWTHALTLPTSADAGFSTAFSPSGVLFAVASQDGLASVFDTRYLAPAGPAGPTRPLTQVQSSCPGEGSSAFRCLKFSAGAEDLLLVAEQAGRVHVVDTRKLEDRQVLTIPPHAARD
ncbi:quinon protein alcohol dehydrogenase-like superfamily, partial [Dipodascopsis tothii]|uniref:quinon protein alcohol dehydrogenase-like superfamily n=1 Tax=Dipodascopsis tothii TaxID=44089 RepID=UPI0034CE936A